MAAASFGDRVTPAEVLNQQSRENRHVAISVTPGGDRVFVVWDGIVAGQRRIVGRESVQGEWLNEFVLDAEPAAANHSPDVAVDHMGNVHVVWLGRQSERDVVFYTARISEAWVPPIPLVAADDLRGSADAVTIAVAPDGRPWIAWQSGTANRVNIYCAELCADRGEFVVHRLTPEAINYNLMPSIQFEHDTPVVYWYAAENATFSLIAARFLREQKTWELFVPKNLDQLPANRLPGLFAKGQEALAGIWYDQVQETERIFLGLQDPLTRGAGTIIDHRPRALNHPVVGTFSSGNLIAVWCSMDDQTSRPQVFYTRGVQLPTDHPDVLQVSDGRTSGFYNAPAVAPFDGGVVVTYTSDAAQGGDGSVLFQKILFE
ncbi:MAG: hypothetical protein D6691_06285 [Candidatus Hydrogenedentota bacterium]|jgi:hypothetical protein|nr:MAG: hypothetical protein D6691_06285 [Candidatus Hydrogenedentota bacterium]